MSLSFEIVTARGVTFREDCLERVVVRRREERFVPGSEIAIYPHHGPLLMQTQACEMRLTREGTTRSMAVDAGVLEIWKDRVTLVIT